MPATRVVLLPGGVLPADLAYGSLIEALGDDVDAVTKDLEVYAADEPPDDYSLDLEVAGVLREAAARGWKRFHLGGYSAGGRVSTRVCCASRRSTAESGPRARVGGELGSESCRGGAAAGRRAAREPP